MDRYAVINRVMSGDLTQILASEELNLSQRQIRRLVKRVKEEGARGILPRHQGGNRRIPLEVKEEIMERVQGVYADFGPTFAAEKLKADGYSISKETLRQWMGEYGLRKERKSHTLKVHQSRKRRDFFGELIQIDGSYHDWFEGRRASCCLLVFIDDATSRLVGLRFCERETTLDYMIVMKEHIKKYGRPCSYYSDRHAIFRTSRKDGISGHYPDTQIERALKELNIKLFCAYTPQAKGRVERANKTLQDRLIKEMRLHNISSLAQANTYAQAFIDEYNARFSVKAIHEGDAHRTLTCDQEKLEKILSIQSERKLSKNLEFSFESKLYQITTPNMKNRLINKIVTVQQHTDGRITLTVAGKELSYSILKKNKSDFSERISINLELDKKQMQNQVISSQDQAYSTTL